MGLSLSGISSEEERGMKGEDNGDGEDEEEERRGEECMSRKSIRESLFLQIHEDARKDIVSYIGPKESQ